MDLESMSAILQRSYGDDVAQEAIMQALEHADGSPWYAAFIAKKLHAKRFHDGLLPARRAKLWWREQPDHYRLSRICRRSSLDPYAMVLARLELRAIPLWLLDQCVNDGLTCRHRCEHSMDRWFMATLGGKRTVRCRGCLAAGSRTHYWRGQESVHVSGM